jgi:hypothetical protein
MKLILIAAFMMSSTAALAACPPAAYRMIQQMGRQPQKDQIECHSNGMKGNPTLWVMVGKQPVGYCPRSGDPVKKWPICQPSP